MRLSSIFWSETVQQRWYRSTVLYESFPPLLLSSHPLHAIPASGTGADAVDGRGGGGGGRAVGGDGGSHLFCCISSAITLPLRTSSASAAYLPWFYAYIHTLLLHIVYALYAGSRVTIATFVFRPLRTYLCPALLPTHTAPRALLALRGMCLWTGWKGEGVWFGWMPPVFCALLPV
jgi:hypothetical protein